MYLISLFILLNLAHADCKLYPIAVRLPLNGTPPDLGGSLWPRPNFLQFGPERFYIDKNLKIELDSGLNVCEKDLLEKLWAHYHSVLYPPKLNFQAPASSDLVLKSISFKLITNSPEFSLSSCAEKYYPFIQDTETESYKLNAERIGVQVVAKSVWGLIRGLETFSQLVYTPLNTNKLAINQTNISDAPRFYHRGIMLDSSRHFIPIPLLKKHLDTMMYNKMNVFHWHLVDDQSFPLESKTYPNLHKKGAYSENHVYNQEEIKELIEFARIRGIRIIPELDTPGHTYSWGLGYPELITICWEDGKPFQAIYNVQGQREILNPIQNLTYDFVSNLIAEFKGLFSDPFIHLGMDEVYYSCWESNPNISQFMLLNGLNSTRDLEQYYMSRILTSANKLGYKVTVWQDVWDNKVKVFNDTILQIWKSEEDWRGYVQNATQDGYNVILSSPWYLNYIKYGSDWYEFYKVEPTDFEGTEEQKKRIVGGEACMWSEFVDGANSISRLWPRASAVAERLWSSIDLDDVEEAKFRLDEHRCRLLRRGIEAGPIFNSFCGEYEPYMKKNVLNEEIFNYLETRRNMRAFMRVIRALFIRLMFIAYMLLCIWRVTFVSDNKYYWLMIVSVGFLLIETGILLWLRAGKEFRGILPSVLLFLSCVLPSIWIMCIDEAHRKTKFQSLAENQETNIKAFVLNLDLQKSDPFTNASIKSGVFSLKKSLQTTVANQVLGREHRSAQNYSTIASALKRRPTTTLVNKPSDIDCCDVKISYWFQEDNFQHLFYQILMFVLVLSRWLITRSDISLNQRSLILIISLATAADTLDFFGYLSLELVYRNNYLLFSVLLILTLSLFQFVFLSLEETFSHSLDEANEHLDENLNDSKALEKNEKFPFLHKHYEFLKKQLKGDPAEKEKNFNFDRGTDKQNWLCHLSDPLFFILLAGLFLHDGSFLTFRIFAWSKLGSESILSQSPLLIFFMAKNILIILTQTFKVYTVSNERRQKRIMETYRDYMQQQMNCNPNFVSQNQIAAAATGGQIPLVSGYANFNQYAQNSPYRFAQVYNDNVAGNQNRGLNRSISSLSTNTGYFGEKNFKPHPEGGENAAYFQPGSEQNNNYVMKQQQYDANIMLCQNMQSNLSTPNNPFSNKVGKALYGLQFLSRSKTSLGGQDTGTNLSNGPGVASTFRNNSFSQPKNLKASKI